MFKLLVFFGTRPEVIKLAPVILKLKKIANVQTVVVNTGQHRELTDAAIEAFSLHIDHNLCVMNTDQTLSALTANLLTHFAGLIETEKPDLIMVQGDTATAFTASLLGYYHQIPVAHVEAGLRSYDKFHPFPEEFNRQAIGFLADWHFAPREEDATHLLNQGCTPNRVFTVGNTIVDALHYMLSHKKPKHMRSEESLKIEELSQKHKIVLITAHRRENFGLPLKSICKSILQLAEMNRDVYFLFCVHLNPNVQKTVYELLAGQENIILSLGFSYIDFIFIMSYTYCILTDSGGIQEEAAVLHKPTLVLRKTTERHEGIRVGIAKLVGSDSKLIINECNQLLNDPHAYKSMLNPQARYIYGDGTASKKIIETLSPLWEK
ncbi:MAG: UDP-N-acetylglucosamine 2-epimerase (non-hydrolyzing) [Parachlamydiaceae bacterium]|nr:UDP-N-acetylglucosamine 2-epimerase (non-hydrolyzing) [Parachlamydiaceae bacterium]